MGTHGHRCGAPVPSKCLALEGCCGKPWPRSYMANSEQSASTLAQLLGLNADSTWFEQALTHPSFANERPEAEDNQRLEFLGDAVLGLCASELLFERFPTAPEGSLTRLRAQLVN